MQADRALDWLKANRPHGLRAGNGDIVYFNGADVEIETQSDRPEMLDPSDFLQNYSAYTFRECSAEDHATA